MQMLYSRQNMEVKKKMRRPPFIYGAVAKHSIASDWTSGADRLWKMEAAEENLHDLVYRIYRWQADSAWHHRGYASFFM